MHCTGRESMVLLLAQDQVRKAAGEAAAAVALRRKASAGLAAAASAEASLALQQAGAQAAAQESADKRILGMKQLGSLRSRLADSEAKNAASTAEAAAALQVCLQSTLNPSKGSALHLKLLLLPSDRFEGISRYESSAMMAHCSMVRVQHI